jgi:hypothetical protein
VLATVFFCKWPTKSRQPDHELPFALDFLHCPQPLRLANRGGPIRQAVGILTPNRISVFSAVLYLVFFIKIPALLLPQIKPIYTVKYLENS